MIKLSLDIKEGILNFTEDYSFYGNQIQKSTTINKEEMTSKILVLNASDITVFFSRKMWSDFFSSKKLKSSLSFL